MGMGTPDEIGATSSRWLHRRLWVRPGSPLWAFLLLLDAIEWLAFQLARLMGLRDV